MQNTSDAIGIKQVVHYFASTSQTFDDLNLTIEAFRVYMHLLRRSNGGQHESWSSYRAIGEHCFRATFRNVKPETLRRKAMDAIAELEYYGLIKVVERKQTKNPLAPDSLNNLTNLYFIQPPYLVDMSTPILKDSYNIRRENKKEKSILSGESDSPGSTSQITQSITNEFVNTDNWEENATLLKEDGKPDRLITYSLNLEGGETYETQNKTELLSKVVMTPRKPRKKKNFTIRELSLEQQKQVVDNYNKHLPINMEPYKGKSRSDEPLTKKAWETLRTCINDEFNGDVDLYLDAARRALLALKHTSNDFYRLINWDFVAFHTNGKVSEWDRKYDQIMQEFQTRFRKMSLSEIRDYDPQFDQKYTYKLGGYKFRDGKYYIFVPNAARTGFVELEWFSPEVCQKVTELDIDFVKRYDVPIIPGYKISPRFFRVVYWTLQGKCQLKQIVFDKKSVNGQVMNFPMYQSTDVVFARDEYLCDPSQWLTYAADVWKITR